MATLLRFPEIAEQGLVVILIFQLCFYYSDLYNLNVLHGRTEQLICLGQSLGSACVLLGALYYIFPSLLIGRGTFLISVVLIGAFVTINRVVLDQGLADRRSEAEYRHSGNPRNGPERGSRAHRPRRPQREPGGFH
jgi:hypothetical protein